MTGSAILDREVSGTMAQRLRDLLLEAARTGEVLRIIYHGGSQPGTVRDISPVSLDDEYVEARELSTSIVKTFRINHMEIASADTTAVLYDPTRPKEPPPRKEPEPHCPLDVALADKIDGLRALGWHVIAAPDIVGLHHMTKNGKRPLKNPTVQIVYAPPDESSPSKAEEEVESVVVFGADVDVESATVTAYTSSHTHVVTRSRRLPPVLPYHVYSPRISYRRYGKLSTAIPAFLQEATELAPRPRAP